MLETHRLRVARWTVGIAVAAIAAGGTAFTHLSARQAAPSASLYEGLSWRNLGPTRGGRVDAVSGVPGRPNEFYSGAVNGGVWKSVDAGRVWTPVFDRESVASIGALAVAPSSPDTVYVGTGESTLRDSMGYGAGMYKSTDAGKTWTRIGLENTQHIARVAVDPKNAAIVFVAALGHLYDANPDRGIFKTIDGGKTWKKVLFVNNDVGASDVVIDPVNPLVVYASLWNTRRPPWYTYQPSNGPGGGIFKSVDGGATWKPLTKGLPNACVGKVGIAVAPSRPARVYAVVDDFLTEGAAANSPCPGVPPGRGTGAAPATPQGGFYQSDDAGMTWTKLSSDAALWGRGWYFEHVTVDPKNADIVYVPNVSVSRSKDGGRTWAALRGSPGGDDYHQAWISPDDPNTMIVASDQGTIITRNARVDDPRQVTWSSWLNQPIAQIYHVSVDSRFPYWVTGAQQDSGAVAVRSRGKFAGISMRDWEPIGAGGESGMTAADSRHPGIIFGGTGTRWDLDLNAAAGVVTAPRAANNETGRTDWTQPLVFSKADASTLFYANQFLFKSTDDAKTWTQISPDLTRPDPGVPASVDATAAQDTDRNGKRGVIYTIAPSPKSASTIWIGTDDGLIQLTTDGGRTWQNVTPPAVDAWSRVTTMEASHSDVNEVYASIDRHQLGDFEPHIYRSRDMGKTWQAITTGLRAGAYVHVVKEDPARRGLLFAGTEREACVSFDDGDHWQSLQLNLPTTSVRDFEIYGNDLIVATHGRGFWVIDDISPLRQLGDAVTNADVYLFKPADAVLVLQGGDNGTPTQKDEPQLENPANGATIDYYLKTAATGPVTLEIVDTAGAVVTTMSSANAPTAAGGRGGAAAGAIPNTSALWRATPTAFSADAGMHRVHWAPGGGGRRGGGAGAGAAMGTYTARLTVAGKVLTQTFVLKPDPRQK